MSHTQGLKCTQCGKEFTYQFPMNICPECGSVLFIHYDIEDVKNHLTARKLRNRRPGVWKYSELLPDIDASKRVSLGEGGTYLHKCDRLAAEIGLEELYLKDETTNPTGSFLDRGMSLEISAARQWDIKSVHNRGLDAGNMSASLVAYAARGGLGCKTFIVKMGDIHLGKLHQILAHASEIEIVGSKDEALRRSEEESRWSHCVRCTNPHFLEGKKTTVLEIYEQLNWDRPDWIVAPMGTGGNVSAIWKGIRELESVGLIDTTRPHIVGAQAACCAPIVNAYEEISGKVNPSGAKTTVALPIAISNPLCEKTALEVILQSNGLGMRVTDKEILNAVMLLSRLEGVYAEPASATTIAVLQKLVKSGRIQRDERVVCIITGTGLKYPEFAKTLVERNDELEQLLTEMERRKVTTQLGQTKIQILRILAEGETYGYEIWKKLGEVAGISVKVPGVYQHLSDLVNNGLVIKTKTIQVLKRMRTYYGISEKGRYTVTQLDKLDR
ncbi:MAG: threonine synthase [Candidatus Thorarchaeota archaeon]|nr:MAG: threonine synthase [Candidatus Thorarchaeota archaeon]